MKLTVGQQGEFETLERICKFGRVVFYMVCKSFLTIKTKKYFMSKGLTFEKYCESIGYSPNYVNRLIASAKMLNDMPEDVAMQIQNEASARAINAIPSTLRLEVAVKASAGGTKPITSMGVKKVVSALPPVRKQAAAKPPAHKKALTRPDKVIVKDRTGLEIPVESLAIWERRDEITQLLTELSMVRQKLRVARGWEEELNKDGSVLRKAKEFDILFAEVDFVHTEAQLNQAYEDLKTALPYAVCPDCNGKTPKGCLVCDERGFVSEFYWKVKVPAEIKEATGRK